MAVILYLSLCKDIEQQVAAMADIKSMIFDIQEAHRKLDEKDGWYDQQQRPWMGEGCSEEEVAALEHRLQVRLPASYRSFLLQVNGCGRLGISLGGLLPAEQVDWFHVKNEAWIRAYTDHSTDDISEAAHRVYGPDQATTHYRSEYLHHILQIGDVFDGAVYLLNPRVLNDDSEWEAWTFCNSYPGAHRLPSFQDLIVDDWTEICHLGREIDEERLISEALAVMRQEITMHQVAPQVALAKYIALKMSTDPEFAAWAYRSNVVDILLSALERAHDE